jgi:hypothetical protein
MFSHKELLGLMGKQVVVHQRLNRKEVRDGVGYNTSYWNTNDITPRTGWIVGIRWMLEGYTVPGSRSFSMYEEFEEPYFVETGRVKCLLVNFWPTETPVQIPINGFNMPEEFSVAPEPYCSSAPTLEERQKMSEFMKEEVKLIPRDNKGRFSSYEE